MIQSGEHQIRRCWGWPRFALYTGLLALVYFVSQVIGVLVAMIVIVVRTGASAAELSGMDINTILAPLVVASAMTCIPLVRYLAGRCERRPWEFLGLRTCSARHIALSGVAIVALITAMDLASRAVGRPMVTPFMADAYASTASPLLLFVALVVAAPLCEELLFRGFLFGGLRACGARLWVAIAVVSIVFAAIHTQYDWYDGTSILLIGFALIGARVHFGSVIPSIFMHSLTNAIAFTQAALFS